MTDLHQPKIYSVYHLNLAFSSIEEDERLAVIKRCYDPLLDIAESAAPIGIELTGYSLQAIKALKPDWISRCKSLIKLGRVEIIASGYAQIIAPLVDPMVTHKNLELGQEIYQRILGIQPKIALVNEQSYSPGIVPIYRCAGFEALMMDWADPASYHDDWSPQYRLRPQTLVGEDNQTISVLWSDAMGFQKFQRYAHGEVSLDEYSEYLTRMLSNGAQALPLYTSDAEVFDYRPGRFDTEANLPRSFAEWQRIHLLLKAIAVIPSIDMVLPSAALREIGSQQLRLETAQQPIPVKKQKKYNVLRWGATGRDDLKLNTLCWRILEYAKAHGVRDKAFWFDFLELFASDYRTHITEKRWKKLAEKFKRFHIPLNHTMPLRLLAAKGQQTFLSLVDIHIAIENSPMYQVARKGRFLTFRYNDCFLVLNLNRGLAVQAFGFGDAPLSSLDMGEAIVGTIGHGYYDDIAMGADFYTGHLVYEPVAGPKITDLINVENSVEFALLGDKIQCRFCFESAVGPITKHLVFSGKNQTLEIEYEFDHKFPLHGSLHIGFMTINPEFFDMNSLYYEAKNGGQKAERHYIKANKKQTATVKTINHSASVSRLVSATTGLGLTDGTLVISDGHHKAEMIMKRSDCAGIGMIDCKPIDDTFFMRSFTSLRETDETSRRPALAVLDDYDNPVFKYTLSIS